MDPVSAVGWIRVRPPLKRWITPARQIVIRKHNVRTLNGVPVWEPAVDRQHIDCATAHPERQRVAFYGNSITFGAGVRSAESFAWILEDRLNRAQPHPGFCVMNFAVPGFRFGQKFAVAQETLPRYHPALAFYQDWDMEWGGVGCPASGEYPPEYVRVGDEVFGIMGLRLRRDGLPGVAHVPDGLNSLLFRHSHLYQYLTLALGEPSPPRPMCEPGAESSFRIRSLRRFTAAARAVGARPIFYLAADLTYPLNQTHARETAQEQPLVDMGLSDGVPVIKLRDVLHNQDNVAIRMDDWHYNPTGHRVLAQRFERIVLDALRPAPPSP